MTAPGPREHLEAAVRRQFTDVVIAARAALTVTQFTDAINGAAAKILRAADDYRAADQIAAATRRETLDHAAAPRRART